MCALPAHLVTLALQEDADAAIAVARILLRQAAHRREHRRVAQRQLSLVAQYRTCDTDQLASAALRVPSLDGEGNLVAPDLRAHHFRRLISFSVSMAFRARPACA